jgi:UrcA family protein
VSRDRFSGFAKLKRDIAMKIATNARFALRPSMVAAALVALVCAASGNTTLAWEPGEPLTKKVAYGDLDLQTEQGASSLYKRLRVAAEQVCTPYQSIDLARRVAWQTCVDRAVASAVEQVNRPMVTAVHNRTVNRSSTG